MNGTNGLKTVLEESMLARCGWAVPTLVFVALLLVAPRFGASLPPALADPATLPAVADPAAVQFFEEHVRPVLATNCYSCHGADAQQGGLRVDSRAALLTGGKGGPAITPGAPDKSLLLTAVHQTGPVKMPLGGKLKPAEIDALDAWVKMGAPWPLAAANAEPGGYALSPAQKRFWSFQPVMRPKLPAVKNAAWARTPIDRFVLAKLEARGLGPAPPADKRTLIRRATFDLTGLPPTPAEIDAFLADKTPTAFAKVVDRLLASPRYGECWARHWLDVARYADTKGYVFNEDRNYPGAYTYRDWVIRAFNADLPYDQFIKQQIAADRLPTKDADPRSLAALGFLTVGRRFLNQDPDIINDRIDVTMRGFQGITVACARCHDHKFDPIPTKDYYSLYSVFASSRETSPVIAPRAVAAPYDAYRAQLAGLEAKEQALVLAQIDALRERQKKDDASLTQAVREVLQATGVGARPSPENLAKIEPPFAPDARATLKTLREAATALRRNAPPKPETAMALEDAPTPVEQHVFKRGNPGNPGDPAPARFLQVLSPPRRETWTKGSGRLELARAIASPSNPLTARVFVNRVWLGHFGAGLVRTPSDFGKQGERPTHPELLDYLASTFMAQGWSVKKLHRQIMLSAAYRQSADHADEKAPTVDPENRLLWHMNRRRLELEPMRDTLLSVAGTLDVKAVGGPSVDIWSRPYPTRRTLYGFIDRQNLPGVYRTFDLASPDATSPQRFITTVPQQALFFLNSPFVAEQARALASRPDIAGGDDARRIRALYRRLFGREASPQEIALGLRYVHASPSPAAPKAPAPLWRCGYGRYAEAAQRVSAFAPLPTFTNGVWHGLVGPPDPQLRFLLLNADGGHPGVDADHAAIRRWVAPQAGAVTIGGRLKHPSDQGDGVRGRIVSSRSGLLGEWVVQHGEAATNVAAVTVQKGDTLDFVADCRTNDGFDGFAWSPTITLVGGQASWSAQAQFRGPPEPLERVTAWERYIQALMMTNEFVFID